MCWHYCSRARDSTAQEAVWAQNKKMVLNVEEKQS